MRRTVLVASLAFSALSGGAVLAPGDGIPALLCPTTPDPAELPDAATLRQMNAFVADLGVRPTGSPQQSSYVAWIRDRLSEIPGVAIDEIPFSIDRWSASSASLSVNANGQVLEVPIANPIPYTSPTGPGGVTAPLEVIPSDQTITAANSAGIIVVRQAPAGSIPMYDLFLPVVSWEIYDPKLTISPLDTFYGDFINYNARVADLRDAASAGAKGILFLKDLPRSQLLGHYEPYEGTAWGVPGVFLGADEGKTVIDALAGDPNASARLVIEGGFDQVTTPSIIATIPGQSPERIVIDSHTDGTNAVEDNGPVAMVAMASYFATLPLECRPRTVQFAFSTGHFFQRLVDSDRRHGGAGVFAQMLDADYDTGTVAAVIVLEHLGAIDYEGVPRTDGGPGQVLAQNGLRAIQFIAVTPSPALVAEVDSVVRSYNMERTILLQGADAPAASAPSHCSFGGEGTPYNQHLLPTIGVISAPQSLYDPAFGLEGIDFGVMHDELLGFTELVNRLQTLDRSLIAGETPIDRARRANGAAGCPAEN